MYRSLDPEKINATIRKLCRRIDERFPDSGLGKVGREVLSTADESQQLTESIAKVNIPILFIVVVLIAIVVVGLIRALSSVTGPKGGLDLIALVQVSEAGLNVFILLSAAILFLVTGEARLRRRRALKAIHELRALAHVIDMHQLTKDPERILSPGTSGSSSTKRDLSQTELMWYLDYCSEMLSLIGKLAALHVQKFNDPVALAAVNEVEGLTTGLSGKIWQKIMILNSDLAKTDAQAILQAANKP